MKLTEIESAVNSQKERLSTDLGLQRDMMTSVVQPRNGFATVVSGIRRCGKSTLMAQVIDKMSEPSLYINFDTPKLNSFSMDDFDLVNELAMKTGSRNLFFDEIQLVSGWESYVRSALDAGYRVMVTGSNATMLSRELGTRLTGRHITKELFPFSYQEYCRFRNMQPSTDSLNGYLKEGGFPQYLKQRDEVVLEMLLDDILYRDIAVRYSVRDEIALRNLMIYLITNIGNLVSANKLTSAVQVRTAKTVLEYFSYYVQTYLLSFVSRFSYSYRSQMISPKKVYCIDNGLHLAVTTSANTDEGRRLENMVYGELRQRYKQIFYYNDGHGECDFIVCEKNVPTAAFQVCYELNRENESQELGGLLSAMEELHISSGKILTFNQSDAIIKDGKRIAVTPVWDSTAF